MSYIQSILVGDERGQIKKIQPDYEKLNRITENSSTGPFHTQLLFSLLSEKENDHPLSIECVQCHSALNDSKWIVVGFQNGRVDIINIMNQDANSRIITSIPPPENQDIHSLNYSSFLLESIDKDNEELHIAILYGYGLFKYYKISIELLATNIDSNPILSINLNDSKNRQKYQFTCMKVLWRRNSEESIFATGGNNTPLELWKWNSGKFVCIFTSKLSTDSQHLNLPFIVNDIDFITSNDSMIHELPITVMGLSDKQIHVYDPRLNNHKPIFSKKVSDSSIQNVHYIPKARILLFSDIRGNLEGLDERSSFKGFGKYRDFVGSITQIIHYDNPIDTKQQFIVTTCLDRFIRWHDVQSKSLIMKIYMVQRLKSLCLINDAITSRNEQTTDNTDEEELDQLFVSIPVSREISASDIKQ